MGLSNLSDRMSALEAPPRVAPSILPIPCLPVPGVAMRQETDGRTGCTTLQSDGQEPSGPAWDHASSSLEAPVQPRARCASPRDRTRAARSRGPSGGMSTGGGDMLDGPTGIPRSSTSDGALGPRRYRGDRRWIAKIRSFSHPCMGGSSRTNQSVGTGHREHLGGHLEGQPTSPASMRLIMPRTGSKGSPASARYGGRPMRRSTRDVSRHTSSSVSPERSRDGESGWFGSHP